MMRSIRTRLIQSPRSFCEDGAGVLALGVLLVVGLHFPGVI